MDDLTPMDPTFREEPPEQPAQIPDYYGTGCRPRHATSHFPVVLLLLFFLVAANLITLFFFSTIWRRSNIEAPQNSGDGVNPLIVSDTGTDVPTTQEDPSLNVQTDAAELTLQELYQKAMPSVAVVTAQIAGETVTGTAVVLTRDGYLLVNAHTVSGASKLRVTLTSGSELTASFVGMDEVSDLAVLKVAADGLTPAEIGDSSALVAGDSLVAICAPFGNELSATMVEGILSAVSKDVTLAGVPVTIFQTNLSLASKETGGVLFNHAGQLVAIGLHEIAGFVSFESAEGIGFALPISEANGIVNDLISYGCVGGRASLGVEITELTEPQRIYWDLPKGVLISSISTDSNAYLAGLREGDVLLAIDETTISDISSYINALNQYAAGDTVRIYLYRGGTKYYVDIVLNEKSTAK